MPKCGSEPLRPQQGVGQVKQQACGNEGGERIIEDHGCAPQRRFRAKETRQDSKPLASIGVAYSRDEEAEAEGQHDDVQHEVLLCVAIGGTRGGPFALVGW